MTRLSQVGIAVAALGAMLVLMGLFPGVTGLSPTPGVGLVQLFGILMGFYLFILGALFYVKMAFYVHVPSNLAQQIGVRLALTGLVLMPLFGLADSLGFGSHGVTIDGDVFLGPLQSGGMVGSYAMSCLGVLIFALAGRPEADEDETTDMDPVP